METNKIMQYPFTHLLEVLSAAQNSKSSSADTMELALPSLLSCAADTLLTESAQRGKSEVLSV